METAERISNMNWIGIPTPQERLKRLEDEMIKINPRLAAQISAERAAEDERNAMLAAEAETADETAEKGVRTPPAPAPQE